MELRPTNSDYIRLDDILNIDPGARVYVAGWGRGWVKSFFSPSDQSGACAILTLVNAENVVTTFRNSATRISFDR
jgi:hypothetical protein